MFSLSHQGLTGNTWSRRHVTRVLRSWTVALLDLLATPALRMGTLASFRKSILATLPHDAPRGHAQGQRVQRVLMVGSGPAMGWGVATHELALCGALARAITRRTSRGCEVDLMAEADLNVAGALKYVTSHNLEQYDSVVLVLGVNDAIWATPYSAWSLRMGALLETTLNVTLASTHILVVGVQPLRSISVFDSPLGAVAARRARRLNALTHRICSRSDRTRFSPLAAPSQNTALRGDEHFAAKYASWAEGMAPSIAAALDATNAHDVTLRRQEADELLRMESVLSLRLDELRSNKAIHHAVTHAKSAFRARTALFTVLSLEEQHQIVHSGEPLPGVPLADSFCNIAIDQRDPLVIIDTLNDDRFSSSALVATSPFVRFYAGVPIRTPSGQRIGALCVLDGEPRERVDDVSLDCLRELAVLVENEIWRVQAAVGR